jgi:hypothetical protein
MFENRRTRELFVQIKPLLCFRSYPTNFYVVAYMTSVEVSADDAVLICDVMSVYRWITDELIVYK